MSTKQNPKAQDLNYLEYAYELATKGEYTTSPNPPVGCVITNDGRIIGEGWHQYAGCPHAEVNALQHAQSQGYQTADATVYVTLEPCNHTGKTPPCTEALIKAKVKRVVIALVDVDKRTATLGIKTLQQHGIEVDSQTANGSAIQDKIKQLCRGYLSRQQRQRPFTTLKIASSLDGKIALHNRQSKWITGEEARADVHLLRRQYDAILSTHHTVKEDNPHFTVRLSKQQQQQLGIDNAKQPLPQPTLCILDTRLSLTLHQHLNILYAPRDIWIFHKSNLSTQTLDLYQENIAKLEKIDAIKANINLVPTPVLPTTENTQQKNSSRATQTTAEASLNLSEVLFYCGKQEINSVLIEAGATLNGALLEAKKPPSSPKNTADEHKTISAYPLVDEYIYYINSKIMGTHAKEAFHTATLSQMQACHRLTIDKVKIITQNDIKLIMSN